MLKHISHGDFVSLTSTKRQFKASLATPLDVKHKGNMEKENYFQNI